MQLIAHRGASGHAPENTLAAFRLALQMGAKAMELDVHQGRDGSLLVIHDPDLKRVGRKKILVQRLSRAEAKASDVGSWFAPQFKGEGIAALEEVLSLAQGKAQVHIEIKNGSSVYPGIEERVVALLKKRKAWSQTMVSSFDHQALFRVRDLSARARLGYLLGLTSLRRAWREMAELKAESLNLSVSQVSAGRVKESHQRGLKVFVYTVNTPAIIEKMQRLGVDGVYSNFPELQTL